MNPRSLIFILSLCLTPFMGISQVVYQDLNKTSVYEFLDEMANQQLIELNTFSKPYSRKLIAEKLSELNPEDLNARQKEELIFFLKDFNKELKKDDNFDKRYDLFYYKDSLFSFTLNPILGLRYSTNQNGLNWHRWSGGEVFGSIGENFGFYANLRDNQEKDLSQNELFLNRNAGVVYKSSGDFSEMRGGLTYSWNWGSIGLIKDDFSWGNQQFGANIFSGKAPSFSRLELKLNPVKWLDFTYFHGWLASEVRDSSRSYLAGVRQRNIDVNKFIASNVFTVRAMKGLNISLGNSIIYSDNLQAAFFIPFMFFKSIDHTVYSGSGNFGGANTQMFFDLSSRNIKNIHIYSSFYIDEISISRFWSSSQHSNFISGKLGVQFSNLWNKNISLSAEYTRTNPITFKHFVNTTTFESNEFNLGHYLRDNAQELALGVYYRPIARLSLSSTFILAEKGEDNEYTGVSKDVLGLDFLKEVKWSSKAVSLELNYELFNDVHFFFSYQYRELSGAQQLIYTQEMFHNTSNTFSFGANIGF